MQPIDLERFVRAQSETYDDALAEVTAGQKTSHWMWYIFPQFAGLGTSEASRMFAITSADEARAYLQHPTLGPRLVAISSALLRLEDLSAREIFGSPDDVKLRSSMTLFASVSPDGSVFHKVLDRYYRGEQDRRTLDLMAEEESDE
jgi:uncharacterized protein (DUF1810 family)